ncbi:hypothetical protein OIDMADRAFT_148820 [Oidiodendron maius Zn]|uniref:SnoaL-like domain-containing protein n=1 Tax=Oidiodendron maius (strain Zn) TaxID=913774 RepID=A0A0C3CA82_OIDMZ|nr:hypothetical protein OIDMADRAFT_148820 [Oidiodendron maius Zn]
MATPGLDKLTVDQARALVQATTFDIFNEHDQPKRRQLMEKYWVPGITCYSPFGASTGYDALDQTWNGLHADDKASWVFEPSGDLWLDFNVIMQAWIFGRRGEEPGMKGWDIIVINDDGRVKELYAMIEGVSTHPYTV